jgi:dTDP-4-amino-4,6-dideoxygalactose transaminase
VDEDGWLVCMTCARQFSAKEVAMIPPIKVSFLPQDRQEILERIGRALDKGFLAQGENVKEFEEGFARYVGAKHAVATSNGGAALELALRHLRVQGKDVLVPANTFAATATSVVLAGGRPRFVDMNPETLAPSGRHLKKALTPETAGVIVVHVGGIITPEIEKIRAWCDDNGLWLLEDCAHAHGSRMNRKAAGRFGVAGCYSFFATKTMTSGEGGMIVTDDDDLAQAARVMRDYGKPEPWVSYHTVLGSNWRMNELEAAVGVVQLKRLDELIAYREKVAKAYDRYLEEGLSYDGGKHVDFPLKVIRPEGRSSWYKYIVVLPDGVDRDSVKKVMESWNARASGGVFDLPLHRQPVFYEGDALRLPNTERFCARHVCLPIYYGMTNGELVTVVRALAEAVKEVGQTRRIPARRA